MNLTHFFKLSAVSGATSFNSQQPHLDVFHPELALSEINLKQRRGGRGFEMNKHQNEFKTFNHHHLTFQPESA